MKRGKLGAQQGDLEVPPALGPRRSPETQTDEKKSTPAEEQTSSAHASPPGTRKQVTIPRGCMLWDVLSYPLWRMKKYFLKT